MVVFHSKNLVARLGCLAFLNWPDSDIGLACALDARPTRTSFSLSIAQPSILAVRSHGLSYLFIIGVHQFSMYMYLDSCIELYTNLLSCAMGADPGNESDITVFARTDRNGTLYV